MKLSGIKKMMAVTVSFMLIASAGVPVYADAINDSGRILNGDDNYSDWNDEWNKDASDGRPITITVQPSDVTTASGKRVKFSVRAQGAKSLAYQWYYKKKGAKNWSIWKGHTTPDTYAAANDTWNGMQVYCVIDDTTNHISSAVATVTIVNPLKITLQPSDVSVKAGDNATFSVKAQGSGLKYQWYYKKFGAKNWSTWKGHTTATTHAKSNATWDGMQVYCAVSDSSGKTLKSDTAVIRLSGMPKITAQPSDVSVRAGDNVTFSVKAQGSGLKYQWYYKKKGAKNWSIWKNHTTATTCAKSNPTWDKMQAYCIVTDCFGRTQSSRVLTVKLTQ